MRTVYIEADRQIGAARRRYKFTFGPERKIPSGVEANVSLDGRRIGVARGVDGLSPRGRPARWWEVQLTPSLHVEHGTNLTVALRKVLPVALKHPAATR